LRFEAPAGFQGQVDFGTFKLPWGRRHTLLVVLGYSRSVCPMSNVRYYHSIAASVCKLASLTK
jgi:hypothetical protein